MAAYLFSAGFPQAARYRLPPDDDFVPGRRCSCRKKIFDSRAAKWYSNSIMDSMMDNKRLKLIIAAAAGYISLTLFANLGSLRILNIAGLAIDGGTLLYPFTFTMRDLLHKKTGANITRFTIWLAAAVNVLMFAFVWLIGVLPPDMSVGPQSEYALVLSSGLRLVAASIVAMTAAELIDTAVYSLVRRHYGSRKQWLRVLLSNAVSVPIDTAIFLVIGYLGLYDFSVMVGMFVSNLIVKYAVSLLSFGGVYLVKEDNA